MSQAAGFVRLIRRSRFVCRLRGGKLSTNQAEARFVSLDRTGSYSRSYSYFSLAPVPPSFLQARLWGGNRGDEALQKRARFISSSFFFVSRFLAIGKNLKTKALNSECPLPSCFLRPLSPALKSPQPPLPFIDAGSRPFLRCHKLFLWRFQIARRACIHATGGVVASFWTRSKESRELSRRTPR